MKKVYLLLRNNEEKGPFTFDELLLQDLNSSDLIWVEGKSMAWCSPSELEELQEGKEIPSERADANSITSSIQQAASSFSINNFHRNEQNEPVGRNIVATTPPPVYDLEKRAEELRKRVLASNPQTTNYRAPYFQTERTITRDDSPTLYTSKENFDFIYRPRSKKKYVSASHLVIVTIASILVAGVLYGNWSFINPNKGNISVASTIYTSEDEHAAVAESNKEPKETIQPTEIMTLPAEEASVNYTTQAVVKTAGNNKPAEEVVIAETREEVVAEIQEPQPIKKEAKLSPVTVEDVAEKEVKKEPVVAKRDTSDNIRQEEAEEKKGIGKFIKKIFGKKNKNEE